MPFISYLFSVLICLFCIFCSYSQRNKSPRDMNTGESNTTDHSLFIGYGTKAKRVKDRWEATKRLLRFENNYVALKWLLDSFVDEYLRSKQMADTMIATAEPVRKDRREEECIQARQMATRSPPRTRFEEVSESRSRPDMSPPTSAVETRTQSSLKDHKPRPTHDGIRMVPGDKGYMQLPGQYSYKYWSPYYPWPGGVPVNPRLVPVGSIPGYSGYMIKTPSCSSLPTPHRDDEHLKRWASAGVVKDSAKSPEKKEKRPAVNLGFKTKSMPNLQCIPKEEAVSDEEEDMESDPESQGDLIALSSSSLSMPNLHKIPGERAPLLSPPGRRYEQLLREQRDYCSASSYSMPNLQAIHGMKVDDRKKTIRDFVINRLTKNDGEPGNVKTKIFNPNGYFMPPRNHDPEKKLMKQDIRRRLLQRIEAKRQSEESHTAVSPTKKNDKLFKKSCLPKLSENRWISKTFQQESAARGDIRGLAKYDKVNNNWKAPVSSAGQFGPTRDSKGITWDDDQIKKGHTGSSIWNPADVHVKKEVVSEESRNGAEATASNGKSPQAVCTKAGSEDEGEEEEEEENDDDDDDDDEKEKEGDAKQEKKEKEESSDDDEENIDVESYKETDATMDDSGCSESELGDGTW